MLKQVISLTFACLLGSSAVAAEISMASVSFSPKCGINANVAIQGTRVAFDVRKGRIVKSGELAVETEKPLRLDMADYNFDGYTDFAVSHIDDGMGTYSVSYIFVYSTKRDEFVALNRVLI